MCVWLGALLLWAFQASATVVHREQGMFGPVFVVEEDGLLALRYGAPSNADQTLIDPDDAGALHAPYLRAAALGALLAVDPRRALVIGLGGGAFSRFLLRRMPELVVDGVEIDPVVVSIARRFFGLDEDPRLRVHVADGGRFVADRLGETPRTAFDIVLLDAYVGDGIPRHLATADFFVSVSALLTEGGIAILNIGVRDPDEERRIAGAYRSAFRSCIALRVLEDENLIMLAANRRLPDAAELLAKARALDAATPLPFRLDVIARSHAHCMPSRRPRA